MIVPAFVKEGDKIGIAAPGKRIHIRELEGAREIITSWGLTVEFASAVYTESDRYLAASDEQRLYDLQVMMDNPQLSAILCARGGYGTTRILDSLKFDGFKKHPKWLVGFSDITALHLTLFGLGFQSIHGTMPFIFSASDAATSVESLKHVLFGIELPIISRVSENNRGGIASGQVVGGNLSLILDALATSSEPDLNNKILIIEEIDEYLYKMDRMFTQLLRAGKLENLAGLVIGHMTQLKDSSPTFGENIEGIILDKIKGFDYPVAFNFPTGHENPNVAWTHGSVMTLEVTGKESILRPTKPASHSRA